MNKTLICIFFNALLLGGVAFVPVTYAAPKIDCYMIFDAGSSGTRLYFYSHKADGTWEQHEEGKTDTALADPIRKIGPSIEKTITGILTLLDKATYPWKDTCKFKGVLIYATAGMRLGEQIKPDLSLTLLGRLEKELKGKLKPTGTITEGTAFRVRTISGFEEGLYAWLAVKQRVSKSEFAMVEMGGASSQVTFPCTEQSDCKEHDAIWPVIIGDKKLNMYSYSFLGLGQNEAPHSLGFPFGCQFGIGKLVNDWNDASCESHITVRHENKIYDPMNYGKASVGEEAVWGTKVIVPINDMKAAGQIYLTGAFQYYDEKHIQQCCVDKDTTACKHNTEYSCFKPIYLNKYLGALRVKYNPNNVAKEFTWTQGAVTCFDTKCLEKPKDIPCRWMKDLKCLIPPEYPM